MLGLAHTNIRANIPQHVKCHCIKESCLYISQLHLNHRDLGETLYMVFSKGAVWKTYWYVGAFLHLPDSYLKQQHPMSPSYFTPCLIGHFNVTTWGFFPPTSHTNTTQIKLCAWQLRVRQRDMGRESWRQKQSVRKKDWEKRWKEAWEKAGGRK